MKRRDFLVKGTLAAGLATTPGLLKPLEATETAPAKPSLTTRQRPCRNPLTQYLRRAREDDYLPKKPALRGTYLSGVKIIASGDRQKEATEAGADFVGGEEMVEKIQKENWTAFDALIATPDMMKVVGRLGKVLGPKGLMPNPKTGTVTLDVAAAVKEIKAGKVEFRADKTSLVHVPVGKLSFDPQKLIDNATTVIGAIVRSKPSAAKGKYIKSVTLSSTMGPGVPLDSAVADAAGKH